MSGEIFEKKLNQKLEKYFPGRVSVKVEDDCIRVSGQLSEQEDIVRACSMCASKDKRLHVVNDIKLMDTNIQPMKIPKETSKELEGMKPDVLIIGGGISGVSIARELSKWKLNILLVDKEADLAMQASGRNDGEVHPGVDLNKGSLKQHYVLLGNQIFDKVCEELDVPFKRRGQYVGFKQRYFLPLLVAYAWKKKYICGVSDTRIIGRKELRKREPELNDEFVFALYNPSAGCVSPYGLTIAYGENAVQNGAKISLNTAVLGMDVKDNQIVSVTTNKGILHPKLVINAAGTFAEDIATMAKDRFYSIHPRKGTNFILDKKASHLVRSIASIKMITRNKMHTKGGGILRTIDENLLVGPNAIETYEKENFATESKSMEEVFKKQKLTAKGLSERDVITYFTGVRAATFEEDFVIEKGRKTRNLIHCAGIQSPGLTTAPVVALDIEKMVIQELSKTQKVSKNENFNPRRKGIPVLREMSVEERTKMIQNNPNYGIIICRCEEISKGEIIDALNSPISVPTVDGIKKRIRPGMGRCQGGFCMPLVSQIISEHENISIEEVKKSSADAYITLGETKGGLNVKL
jgi:glycerol-3-phosphate dehydrogenase